MTPTEAAEKAAMSFCTENTGYPLADLNMYSAFLAGTCWQASQPSGQGEGKISEMKDAISYAEVIVTKNDVLEKRIEKMRKALQLVKGVFPFHDGDFSVSESNAMLAVEECLDETPTPESQWPTVEEIKKAAQERSSKSPYQFWAIIETEWKAAIQWLQTSAGTREAELEKCLGEALSFIEELKSHGITNWSGEAKAKSLLNPDKTDL